MRKVQRTALRPLRHLLAAAPLVWMGVACDAQDVPPPAPQRVTSAPEGTISKVEVVAAPAAGEAADLIRAEVERAARDGRDLVVYVGATWCEPCNYFHDAAAAGKLDATFPTLRLLEFDHDRDAARLEQAGYKSRMIPLFAIPGPDGRSTGRQMEGSVKGEGAVAEITPRLKRLVAKP